MINKPVVFISATSDLRSARDLVGKVLYSMGYEPVWQDIAATEGGELLDVLRLRIKPCAVVMQLVGQRYGAEPPQPTPEFGRVSYTQFEALYAERLGRKVIYHFVAPGFPADPLPPEADELAELQTAYKEKLVAANRLRHDGIASPGDLELSIRRINDELASLRRQAERRARRSLWLIGATLAGVALLAALVLVVLHQQGKTESRVAAQSAALQDELAEIHKQLQAAIMPKPLGQGQSRPDPLPPELIEKAKILLERGGAEDQALAKIALKQYDEANRIIQDLKSRPGNPIDDAFRLLMLEGDNWYQAGQFDKAIEPYEKSLVLRPTDLMARNNVTLAHNCARLGSIAVHQRRAIAVAEGTLKLVAPGSKAWAITQNNLGNAWRAMPTGDKSENLRKAIDCFKAALSVCTKATDPANWARAINNLGAAWAEMPIGDQAENLGKAIACYEAALTVYTKDSDPAHWAWTQNGLGNAWAEMPKGDTVEKLHKAIACYQAALTVRTRSTDATGWAETQNNLGLAWSEMPTGDRTENLRKTITCYEAALTVYTKDSDPTNWAWTQNGLGGVWAEMPAGTDAENLRKSIACYEAVLTVYTKDSDPSNWAMAQNNLGLAWAEMPIGDKAQNLRKAIACYEAALAVYTKDSDPVDWAWTQNNLGNAWQAMPAGDKGENLRKAIGYIKAALLIYTAETSPRDHARNEELLRSLRKDYESSAGPKAKRLDEIPPAE